MDSSGSVGAGHLVRCLALAQELQSRGVKTFFISQNMLAPLNRFLLSSGHTVIRICQSISSGFNWERDSAETLKALKDISADILIVALGKAEFVTPEMIKKGVCIIDVGITRVKSGKTKSGWKLLGDVAFDSVKHKCSFITPVPGGVGPMTIAMLLKNTLKSAEKQVY